MEDYEQSNLFDRMDPYYEDGMNLNDALWILEAELDYYLPDNVKIDLTTRWLLYNEKKAAAGNEMDIESEEEDDGVPFDARNAFDIIVTANVGYSASTASALLWALGYRNIPPAESLYSLWKIYRNESRLHIQPTDYEIRKARDQIHAAIVNYKALQRTHKYVREEDFAREMQQTKREEEALRRRSLGGSPSSSPSPKKGDNDIFPSIHDIPPALRPDPDPTKTIFGSEDEDFPSPPHRRPLHRYIRRRGGSGAMSLGAHVYIF